MKNTRMFYIPHHQDVEAGRYAPSPAGNFTIYKKDLPPGRAYIEVLMGVK